MVNLYILMLMFTRLHIIPCFVSIELRIWGSLLTLYTIKLTQLFSPSELEYYSNNLQIVFLACNLGSLKFVIDIGLRLHECAT